MRAWIILFLILQQTAYTVEVADTGYAVISTELFVTASEQMDSYTYYLPFPINHLEVYSDITVEGEFTVLGRQTEVVLHFFLEEGESAFFICEYITWEIISKEGTQWWLYLPSMEESITIIMPEGADVSYLVTESDFPLISEESGKIHLFWEYLPAEVYIYYELSLEEGTFKYYWAILLLAFIVGGAALSVLYVRKPRYKKLNKAVLSVLNEREQKIIEYLHSKGRSRQAKISRSCEIPKTSLSKILIKMEERGIVKRERDGNITYCELDERVYR